MDDSWFDSFTRSLVERSGTRRGAIQVVTSGIAGVVLGAIGLVDVEAKKKKKRKKKKKQQQPPPPTESPVGLGPVDAATRDALVEAANNFHDYTLLADHLAQEKQFTPSGEENAWKLVFHQNLLRTFLVTEFRPRGGDGAFLVYGQETTGETWASAYLTKDDNLSSVPVVDHGETERVSPSSVKQSGEIHSKANLHTAEIDLPDEFQRVISDLSDKCLQCEALCQVGLDNAIIGEILGVEKICARFASSVCGKLKDPVKLLACASILWSACEVVVIRVKDEIIEKGCNGACKSEYSCQSCERKDCPAADEYFDKKHCACQCVPAKEDIDLDDIDRPFKKCSGRCIDTSDNRQHCGSCAEECPPSDACNNVTCIESRCTFTPKQNGIICSDDGGTCIQGECFPPTCGANQNTARYWNNGLLSGAPTLVACESWPIDHNWGTGSPGAGIPDNGFSARWIGSVHFAVGSYDFIAQGDDGIRVLLDNQPIIDQWTGNLPEARVTRQLSAGNHDLKVEYQESGGAAVARFRWEDSVPCGANEYRAEYWNNNSLNGSPALVRCEARPINHDWGTGSPGAGIPDNSFSARWTGRAHFDAGLYDFIAQGDDGIRVWLNTDQIINQWTGNLPEARVTRQLSSGDYDLKVEYREGGGSAVARFRWEAAGTCEPTCGITVCNGTTVDTCSSRQHCGACFAFCDTRCRDGFCCFNVPPCGEVCLGCECPTSSYSCCPDGTFPNESCECAPYP